MRLPILDQSILLEALTNNGSTPDVNRLRLINGVTKPEVLEALQRLFDRKLVTLRGTGDHVVASLTPTGIDAAWAYANR